MNEGGPTVGLQHASEDDKGYGLYHSDTRHLEETLEQQFGPSIQDHLVNVTITSPPYADQKDYGYDEDLQIGFGDDYEDYLDELRSVYKQTYDITAGDGSLWIIINTHKRNGRTVRLPFDLADECENLEHVTHCEQCDNRLEKVRETGHLHCPDESCGWSHNPLEESWRLQDVVIWDKIRARPWSNKGRFRNVFEYILCFSKSEEFRFDLDKIRIADPTKFKDWWVNYPERYNPRGKVPDNIWQMVTPTQGGWGDKTLDHPAPFPTELVERIVRMTTDEDDVVFDPFAGTGTVLAQAEAMGRRGLGFELSEAYVEAFPTLREELFEEWEAKQEEAGTLEEQQNELAKTIWKLRQTVYPRKLFQARPAEDSNRSLDELGVNTVFLFSQASTAKYIDPSTDSVRADLFVVVDDEVGDDATTALEEMLQESRDVDPSRAVQVDGDISAMDVRTFLDRFSEMDIGDEPLYLYDRNAHNYPSKRVTIQQWEGKVGAPVEWRADHSKSGYPPVLSNLYVNTDVDGAPIDAGVVHSENGVEVAKTQLTDF